MVDADSLLAAKFPHAPWLVVSTLAPPATGHADLDALFVAIDRLSPREEVESAAQLLRDDARQPAVRGACVRWLEQITSDPAPVPPSPAALAELDEPARARARDLVFLSHSPRQQRARLTGRLVDLLLAEADAETLLLVVSWLARDCDAGILDAIATPLVEVLRRAGGAARETLETLARHLQPGDPLAPLAAEALVIRDGIGAGSEIRRAIAEAKSDWDRARLAVRVSKCKREVDYDREPAWIDILFPGVAQLTWAIELTYPLRSVRTAEPLLRALRCEYAPSMVEAHWADLLAELARVDDPACVPQLEELARGLPDAPKGKRVHRSKGAVLALVRRLKRKRAVVDEASFVAEPGVGTDGGPILAVSSTVAPSWTGVPPDWDGTSSDSDYDRACACSEDGLGALTVAGRSALVIDEQVVQVGRLPDGALLLIAAGTELEVEAVLRDRRAFKRTKIVVDVEDGGLVLLDAARTVDRAEVGAVLPIALAAARYQVFEARRDDAAGRVRVVKLARAK